MSELEDLKAQVAILQTELERAQLEAAHVRRAYLHERDRANRACTALEVHDTELAAKFSEMAYKEPRRSQMTCEVCHKKIWKGWFAIGVAGGPPSPLKCGACSNPPRAEEPPPITALPLNKTHTYVFDTDDVGSLDGHDGIAVTGLFPMDIPYETVLMSPDTARRLAHALIGATLNETEPKVVPESSGLSNEARELLTSYRSELLCKNVGYRLDLPTRLDIASKTARIGVLLSEKTSPTLQARVDELETALRTIRAWDCLNPPKPMSDFPNMLKKQGTIQTLAVEAYNIFRDHILVLADACEEKGLDHDAHWLRHNIGDPAVALPVDHHATRIRTLKIEPIVRQLLRLAAPDFYLSRGPSKKRVVLQIWTRKRRRCVHAFEPKQDVTTGAWLPYTAEFKVRDLDDHEENVKLDLSSEIIAGCLQPRTEKSAVISVPSNGPVYGDDEPYEYGDDDYDMTELY